MLAYEGEASASTASQATRKIHVVGWGWLRGESMHACVHCDLTRAVMGAIGALLARGIEPRVGYVGKPKRP